MRTLPFILLFAAAVPLASCVKEKGGTKTENYIVVGDEVPAFEVNNGLSGEDYRSFVSPAGFEGENTLLVFFTTGCPDCRRELPYAERIWGELGPEGLNVVAISRMDAGEISVRDYWDGRFEMPWYVDPDAKQAYLKFANQTIPRFYLVDEEGIVVWMCIEDLGYDEYTEAKGKKFIELIKEKLNL